MQVSTRWLAATCAATLLAAAAPAAAQEVRFIGFTNGCFGVGCMPTVTQAFQANVSAGGGVLTYANSRFDETTADLMLALGGTPVANALNFNNLGAFSIDASRASAAGTSLLGQEFNLAITFLRPIDIIGGQTTQYTASLRGAVAADGRGGYRIDFADNGARLFSVGEDPLNPIGFFTLQVADVSVNPDASPASVTARIDATAGLAGQAVVPEPSTYALMATGLLALGGVARRRARA